MTSTKFDFVLTDGQAILVDGNYNVKLSTFLSVKFKYSGSYIKYFEGQDDKIKALKHINDELFNDVNQSITLVEKQPTPNTLQWAKDGYQIIDGENGYLVDRYALCKNIFYNFDKDITLDVQKLTITPKPTREQLLSATKQLSTFKTNYSSSTEQRKHNIKLAASMIDGYVIKPMASFSFNEVVGLRTKERGFKESRVIEYGQFVQGIGGGVCQVSTTLYNAALLSGMEINSVTHHSLPVSYVNLSFDAMVSEQTDLVFTNPTEYDIFIKAKATSDDISFTFFGKKLYEEGELKLKSVTVKQLSDYEYKTIPDKDNQLADDETERIISHAKIGYVSEGYLEYYKDNNLVWSKRIRSDTYNPQKGIKLVKDKEVKETLNKNSC